MERPQRYDALQVVCGINGLLLYTPDASAHNAANQVWKTRSRSPNESDSATCNTVRGAVAGIARVADLLRQLGSYRTSGQVADGGT